MGRYSTNMDVFANASVENEVCPFCAHPLPVGVTECKCGAKLDEGGPDMEQKLGARKGIGVMVVFCFAALLAICGMGRRLDWWAWMVPVGGFVFSYLVWPKMENSWHRNGEIGYRQIWIDE